MEAPAALTIVTLGMLVRRPLAAVYTLGALSEDDSADDDDDNDDC